MRIDRSRIERAARMYKSNADAGRALSITGSAFTRLCRHYGITPPHERHARTDHRSERT